MTRPRFVLDTNIISEITKEQPSIDVIAWLFHHEENLYLTAITIGELLEGVYRLPLGKRRENLLLMVERIISAYAKRVFAYDGKAAQIYARMQDETARGGRALAVEDGMIAAICVAENATLATRNIKDFSHLGLELVNPFEEETPAIVRIGL